MLVTIWDDRLNKKAMTYAFRIDLSKDKRFGAKELVKHLDAVITNGGEAFGIRSFAKNVNDSPRGRKSFDRDRLLSLRIVKKRDGRYLAYVLGEVAVSDFKIGVSNRVNAIPDAINDLNIDPIGNENPLAKVGTHSGFFRDPKIRAAVLKRAKGKCEFCGEQGFALVAGGFYVESHHIISLARKGSDTMDNVLALCPSHHREAHYGENSEELELDFKRKLRALRQPLRN